MKAAPTDALNDRERGLTSTEAARRLAVDGPNVLATAAQKTLVTLLLQVLREPMFVMLLVAGGIYLVLGDLAEALFLLAFVFVVIGITLTQERKTQRALEALRDLSAPRALVVRDGKQVRIAGRDVVRGDLLVLHEGDRIPADARLIEGQLSVDESLLTGESVPVAKQSHQTQRVDAAPGDAGMSALFASTIVTKGVGSALVQETGSATAVGHIGQVLSGTEEISSGLQRSSRKLIRYITIVALTLAAALVLTEWLWDGRSLPQSVLAGIALAMAILPEEIPVILTVFLAIGAWRLSRNRVLTRRVPAVEALGSITVLAVDKTGTLTQNRMEVAELAIDGARFTPAEVTLPQQFRTLLEYARRATPQDPFDPMEKAIQNFARVHLGDGPDVREEGPRLEFQYDLAPDILAMTRVFSSEDPRLHLLATKGAPEAVVDLCHLPSAKRQSIQQQVEEMAARGCRVLGVARGRWTAAADDAKWPDSQHDFDFEFLGLIGLADPPRPEVPAAIAECRSAGVRVLMLTGDHPATALAIARQVGLSERAAIITGAEIAELDPLLLSRRLEQTDVCARLRPEQKLDLVRTLQQAGEVVGMTGDGVNDAPALKAADVGVAMGERGTDVAREAAALVLLDDSFSSIVGAIRGGRRIYDNITKATRFVFAAHVPIIALALLPALLHWPILLLPVHIVLLELLIDPACSIVFEAEPAATDLMRRPPRPLAESPFRPGNIAYALAQGVGVAAVLLGGYAWLQRYPAFDEGALRLTIFVALVLAVLQLILANRSAMRHRLLKIRTDNPWLLRMFVSVLFVLAAIILIRPLRGIMGFSAGRPAPLLAGIGLSLVCGLWLQALSWTRGVHAQRAGVRTTASRPDASHPQGPD